MEFLTLLEKKEKVLEFLKVLKHQEDVERLINEEAVKEFLDHLKD